MVMGVPDRVVSGVSVAKSAGQLAWTRLALRSGTAAPRRCPKI